MWHIPLTVTTVFPDLSEDGRTILLVVIGNVKVTVDLPLILLITPASATRVKVTLTKDVKNIAMLKEKNSAAMNSRIIVMRKVKWKKENSVTQKPENKKRNKLHMLIGMMNLVSDIRC